MSFSAICGHEKQIGILRRALEKGRVAHAYLFYGMQGIGKRTTAEVFSRALNCTGGINDVCGRCSSCLKASHGSHPDMLTVEASGQFIRISDIRSLQEKMTFKPFDGGRRVFVVAHAERMNAESSNALLKTLEEPSAANILILVTSRPNALPLTVLSRCQHLRFNPLPITLMAGWLQDRLSIAPEAARLLALSSGGSIGKALEMQESAYIETRDEIIDQVEKNHTNDPLKMLSFAGSFGKDRQDVTKKLDILKGCYRDVLVYKETGEERLLINPDRLESIRVMAARLSGTLILNNIRLVERTYRAVEQNANRALVLEAMALKLS